MRDIFTFDPKSLLPCSQVFNSCFAQRNFPTFILARGKIFGFAKFGRSESRRLSRRGGIKNLAHLHFCEASKRERDYKKMLGEKSPSATFYIVREHREGKLFDDF